MLDDDGIHLLERYDMGEFLPFTLDKMLKQSLEQLRGGSSKLPQVLREAPIPKLIEFHCMRMPGTAQSSLS